MVRKLLFLFAFLGLLVISPTRMKAASICDATAGNIVQNCGFETGDFSNWTENAWGIAGGANSGNLAASTGCVGDQCINGFPPVAPLSQVLTTTAGDSYSLQFAYTPDGGAYNELKVLWDGASIDDLVNEPSSPYATYTVTDLVGTGSDTLTFLGRQDPAFNRLDDVIVSDQVPSGAPEPGTIFLMAGGIVLALASRRFRRA
jgi:hypothetical protein